MPKLIIGARGSKLSVAQTRATIERLEKTFPELDIELKTYDTAGDIDQTTSLTSNSVADNFFSDTLDKAVLSGEVDAAIHSAKDLPDYDGSDIDWFYLPWIEDRRDAVLFPLGKSCPDNPVVGISSPSRETYAKTRWPNCTIKPIRGNIDSRIEQMDRGDFDVILLAVAGLNRLGLDQRISEYVELEVLPTHEFQGTLGITFKRGHPHLNTLRQIMTFPVILAGAGTGHEGNYSVAVKQALENCDLCLHDALLNKEILSHVKGQVVNVGKRYSDGNATEAQASLAKTMLNAARSGKRVVRLKGGDPSLFGRLSEEIGPLSQHNLLFKVLPGIPWICSAPIRHGIYLTNRQEVRHFQVATGTEMEGKAFNTRDLHPSRGPVYFFMSLNKLGSIVSGLIESGYNEDTPCAIFREDPGEKNIVRGKLNNIEACLKKSNLTPPGIFLVGVSADTDQGFSFSQGPLAGKKILCPGSENSRGRLGSFIQALGGIALPLEVFTLQKTSSTTWLNKLTEYDYLVLASGSAVDIMIQLLKEHQIDLRALPPIAVSGPSAAKALRAHGLYPDFMANTFTSESLGLELIRDRHLENKNILVARSDASKSPLPNMLKEAGANVHIETLYENRACEIGNLPQHDAICFCSPSSVEVIWKAQPEALKQSACIASIGPVTSRALKAKGLRVDLEPSTYDAQHLIWALASKLHWT